MEKRNDKIIDINDVKVRMKIKANKAKDWIVDNKETILMSTPIVVSGLATVSKVVGKQLNVIGERKNKETYCYDSSLGHYWYLKRKLTNSEWLTIERRKQSGEKLGYILKSMNVLK